MTYTLLVDDIVDAIDVRPNPHPHHLLTEVHWHERYLGSETTLPSVIVNMFKLLHWSFVPDFAEAVAARRDFSFNAIGFRFPEGLDAGEMAFEGVLVWDYYHKVVISQAAFDRLCSRCFAALEAHASTRTPKVLQTAGWPRFENARQVVSSRLALES
jgi:hypothetical protein